MELTATEWRHEKEIFNFHTPFSNLTLDLLADGTDATTAEDGSYMKCWVGSTRGFNDLNIYPGVGTDVDAVLYIQSEMVYTPDWLFWILWPIALVLLSSPFIVVTV